MSGRGSTRQTVRVTVVLVVCAWIGAAPPSAAQPPLALGTNLAEVSDYSTAVPFADVMKMARAWFTATVDTFDTDEVARLRVDTHGWPVSLTPTAGPSVRFDRVCTLIFSMSPVSGGPRAGQLPYPAGDYTVLYEGTGQMRYDFAARLVSTSPGRDVIRVTPEEPGIRLCITSTDPSGTGHYLRNIRVLLPGTAEGGTLPAFNPAYLARLRPYRVLRFMDWMRTNDSVQRATIDRAAVAHYTYTTARGVPVAVMMGLVNALGAAPWFTMPHAANDDYVRTFATEVRALLPAGQPVYVEYSNELWNGQFSQGDEVQTDALVRYAGQPGTPFDKRLNRIGERAAEICALWSSTFGTRSSDVRCVLAGQAANAYVAETALRCPLSSRAPCGGGFFGVAIAPYLGDYIGSEWHQPTVQAWTREADGGLTRLFRELADGSQLQEADAGSLSGMQPRLAAHAQLAQSFGLQLVAYEGGQHLAGLGAVQQDAAINRLFDAANRDARMGTLYRDLLRQWQAAGGGLFVHFTDIAQQTPWGRWGALELVTETSSPKYDALLAAAQVPPPTDPLTCFFNWAEQAYGHLFPRGQGAAGVLDPYTYRGYPTRPDATYLGTSRLDGHVWVLGPPTGGRLFDAGPLTDWLRTSGCR